MPPSRKRQISAHAAVAGWSSSSGSNAAQLRTTGRPRQRSGSTPHDPIAAAQLPLSESFLLVQPPPQPSSHLSSQFPHCRTSNRFVQPKDFPLAATSSPYSTEKSFCVYSISPRQHSRRDQTPIALLPHRPPAAPLSHLPPDAISCLGAFQTPVAERVGRSSLPASENLHS